MLLQVHVVLVVAGGQEHPHLGQQGEQEAAGIAWEREEEKITSVFGICHHWPSFIMKKGKT